jgi:hypothetical protein
MDTLYLTWNGGKQTKKLYVNEFQSDIHEYWLIAKRKCTKCMFLKKISGGENKRNF